MEKTHDMKHVVFTGPECSGKTTLSTEIAKKFNLPLVEEYARSYLKNLNRAYEYSDLANIAKGQIDAENKQKNKNSDKKVLICDTNLQVIKIWSEFKYSKCDSFIIKNQNPNALYILCEPDFKWVYDPLRENPENRNNLFKLYEKDLLTHNRDFIVLNGSFNQRFSLLKNIISKLI